MGPQLYLILALVAAIPATYGYMKVREVVVVHQARADERNKGVEACNIRVGKIEQENRRSTAKAVDEAERAAGTVTDADDKELAEICKRSASCRSRGTL